MKKQFPVIKAVAFICISLFLTYGCEKEVPQRFQRPEWLKGDIISTLQDSGKFTQFLRLMDITEIFRVSLENQLFTVFAPTDSAVNAYIKKIGLDSVGQLNKRQAEELFGLHVLINPRSREQMLYEFSWGQLETPEGEYGSLFNRKQTYSKPYEYKEIVKYYPNYLGDTLLVRGNSAMKIFLPFFTTEYFEDYYGTPEDYLTMYPGSKWSGTQWHNAMVNKIAGTSSGFIYYIDRVVEPPPSIDRYLRDHEEYSLFYDILQRFASYSSSGKNDKDERTYAKNYPNLSFNISQATGPNTGGETAWLYMFSALVPNNDALQSYLDNTILKTYEVIDSVPDTYWIYLLNSHMADVLLIPSRIDTEFKNSYGNEIDIDFSKEVNLSQMCSNGVFYGLNRVLEPYVFSSVTGPIVFDRTFTTFLYILDNTGLLNSLASPEKQYTIFACNDDIIEDAGVRYTTSSSGKIIIQKIGKDGLWFDFTKTEDKVAFIQDFYSLTKIDQEAIDGGEGFLKMANGNHLYYNHGQIQAGGNQIAGDVVEITDSKPSDLNGNLFYVNNAIKQPLNVSQTIAHDDELSTFFNLLTKFGIADSVTDYYETNISFPRISFLIDQADQWTVFAPSNQAFADAETAGLFPITLDSLWTIPDSVITGNDYADIRDVFIPFLQYHFVRDFCIFDDGQLNGDFETQNSYISADGEKLLYNKVTITNTSKNMSVQDGSGQTVNIAHADANRLAQKSVIHKINTCLSLK